MRTISGSQTTQNLFAQRPPPSESKRLGSTISAAVSAGTMSQTDATALTSALSSIDSSLSADRSGAATTGGTSSSSGTRLDPAQMKDRIDGLIDGQVSSGTLTSDQADTLKDLFAQQHGTHGAGRAGPEGQVGLAARLRAAVRTRPAAAIPATCWRASSSSFRRARRAAATRRAARPRTAGARRCCSTSTVEGAPDQGRR